MTSFSLRQFYRRSKLGPAKFTVAIMAASALVAGCGGVGQGTSASNPRPLVTVGTGGSSGTCCASPSESPASSTPARHSSATPRAHSTASQPAQNRGGKTATPAPPPSTPGPAPSTAPTGPAGTGGGCSAASNTPGGPDPWGGCWPGPNNTGVPAGTSLTSYRGSCTIRRSSVVIADEAINCPIIVLGRSVTIKDSMINGTVHTDGSGSVLIEDTTINGGSDHSESVGGANLTVLQDNIYGDQHEVHCYSNCTVENSWLHNNYNGAALGWHENGFFNDGGSNFTVIHNSVYCVGGCTGDITFIPDGNVSYATVSKNLLVATMYASYCLYPSSDPGYKPGIMTHMVVTDNVFQRGRNGKCAIYGPVYGWDRPSKTPDSDGYGNVWSGNMWNNGQSLQP